MVLTLAITVYNRYELLLESFAQVIDDDRIDEILIMDDASEEKYWNKIKELPKFNSKIKVVRQLENRGMSVNKRDAVFNSKNEWVILFDSDNVIGKDYVDAMYVHPDMEFILDDHTIYAPAFARPNFDYRKYEGHRWVSSKHEIMGSTSMKSVMNDPMFQCLLNTCNCVINRKNYLSTWEENKEMKGSDTIWFLYLWLKRGGSITVVPNMHYFHRVHKDSGFMQDCDYNMKKADEVKKLIMEL